MNAAWVPLPAPGAPSRINLMGSSLGACRSCGHHRPSTARDSMARRSGKTPRIGGVQGAHPREVFGRVDADAGCLGADVHRDALAVPEHAQLLEGLDAFERRGRETGV